jgi:hypothetical protein
MERANRTFIRHVPDKGYVICYKTAPGRGKQQIKIGLPYYEEYEQAEAALQRRIRMRLI